MMRLVSVFNLRFGLPACSATRNSRGAWDDLQASVASASRCEKPELRASLLRDFIALSFFPYLIHHQGDSGARNVPIAIGTGQIHCMAKGIL